MCLLLVSCVKLELNGNNKTKEIFTEHKKCSPRQNMLTVSCGCVSVFRCAQKSGTCGTED